MGHELNMVDGKAAMFSVGEVPWHKLGVVLAEPPANAEAAIQAAGLNWEVGLVPVFAWDGKVSVQIPDRQAIVRLDQWGSEGCAPFGLVGEGYQPLQNRDAFRFFDELIETGKVTYETAGALRHGERVWVMARLQEDLEVISADVVQRYVLLSTGHDGKTAVRVRFTPIRVVCQNTLGWAERERKELFRVHHNRRMANRLDDAAAGVRNLIAAYEELGQLFRRMSTTSLAPGHRADYVKQVFPDPRRVANERDDRFELRLLKVEGLRSEAVRLSNEGRGSDLPGVRGTVWAAYNGVTELVDHHLPYRSSWQRLDSIWFGDGERVKDEALELARAICQN